MRIYNETLSVVVILLGVLVVRGCQQTSPHHPVNNTGISQCMNRKLFSDQCYQEAIYTDNNLYRIGVILHGVSQAVSLYSVSCPGGTSTT